MAPGDAPDIEMLFRICGPAWKVLGLLLDDQIASRGKVLQVLRRLATGELTEAEVNEWVRFATTSDIYKP